MPFDLNLEIDGISGIKIYSKLNIQQSFLPSNYPSTLEFITTDVTHILDNGKWVTKLNTIGMPAKILSTTDFRNSMFNGTYEKLALNLSSLPNQVIDPTPPSTGQLRFNPTNPNPQLQNSEERFKNKQQEIKSINREIKQLGGNTQFNSNPGGPYNNINPELKDAREYLESLKRSKPLFRDQL